MSDATKIPMSALILGAAGVIPFAGLALIISSGSCGDCQSQQTWLLQYAALILSFLGGIRWGAAAASGKDVPRQLTLAVIPSLWAWAAINLEPYAVATVTLVVGFALYGLLDWTSPAPGTQPWLARLRIGLTTAVVASLLVTLI